MSKTPLIGLTIIIKGRIIVKNGKNIMLFDFESQIPYLSQPSIISINFLRNEGETSKTY